MRGGKGMQDVRERRIYILVSGEHSCFSDGAVESGSEIEGGTERILEWNSQSIAEYS